MRIFLFNNHLIMLYFLLSEKDTHRETHKYSFGSWNQIKGFLPRRLDIVEGNVQKTERIGLHPKGEDISHARDPQTICSSSGKKTCESEYATSVVSVESEGVAENGEFGFIQ